MGHPELSPAAIDEARNVAVLDDPPFTQEHIAATSYWALSPSERAGVLACTSIVWREEVVGLAQQVEPPNIGLIAAIGGAADMLTIGGVNRINELRQSSRRLGGLSPAEQDELTATSVMVQVNSELGAVARTALETIEDRA